MINKTTQTGGRLNNELLKAITSNEDKVIKTECHFGRSHLVLSIICSNTKRSYTRQFGTLIKQAYRSQKSGG